MIPVALYFLYLFLATVTCQGFAGCRESNFLYNGECQPCPEHCHTCVSNTSCTKCVDIYYGVICQHECPDEQDCECHKTHGYCTYGCPDGRYPEEDSGMCPPCPVNCELCSSLTDCFVCKPGFRGKTCKEVCPKYCETCNITTGNCTVCEEGYFNQNGECQRCQDGCVSCYDYRNCSLCQEGYLELNDGQCIGNCSVVGNVSVSVHGEQEEVYTTYERSSPMCDCDGVPTTKQPCIEYLSCPSSLLCPVVGGDNLQCGAITAYECTHSCHLVEGSNCKCHPEKCDVVKRIPQDLHFCLICKGSFSVSDVSSTSECVTVHKTDDDVYKTAFYIVLGLLIFATCIGIWLLLLRKEQKKKRKQHATEQAEPIHLMHRMRSSQVIPENDMPVQHLNQGEPPDGRPTS